MPEPEGRAQGVIENCPMPRPQASQRAGLLRLPRLSRVQSRGVLYGGKFMPAPPTAEGLEAGVGAQAESVVAGGDEAAEFLE